jgi:ABC-type branched-subunit amino acid transport system substrate-binding protein
VLCTFALFVAACGSGDGNNPRRAARASSSDTARKLVPDHGPCDTSLPRYNVGTITTIESPEFTFRDDAVVLDAAVTAFNARGGVGRHCMTLKVCDAKGDGGRELDCAREIADNHIVATLNDQTAFNDRGVSELLEAAAIPRIGINPSVADLTSTVAFPLDAGPLGTTFMQVVGCTRNGYTKLAAIHVDTPAIGPVFAAMPSLLAAYHATLDTKLPVTAGTTAFDQLTVAAKQTGATCAIFPLGQNEAVQVLQAAKALGTDLRFSGTANNFNADDVKNLGTFARQIYLNSAFPPANASQDRWPILADIIEDLAATGQTATTIKTTSIRAWLATYALVTVVEKFGHPDDISSSAVMAAIKAAKDVDMFGLIPPWTPTFSALPGSPFSSVSQPWYYLSTYDADGTVSVSERRFNVLEELNGTRDYPQPGVTPGAPSSN